MSRTSKTAERTAVLGATALAAAAYALWEARQYTLRRVLVEIPERVDAQLERGASRMPDLRVLHISDLHLAPRDRDRMRWISRLAQIAPDLVVVTGDFHGSLEGGPLALEALGALLELPGLYVHGSNDYFAPKAINPAKYLKGPSGEPSRRPRVDTAILDRELEGAGWLNLDNATAELAVNGWHISARGVDDPHIKRDDYALVSGPFPSHTDLRLGVTHAPYRRVIDEMAIDGADLILAGHTHGGQICLPFVGTLVTNCDLPRAQARGLSRWNSSALHVSAGLGTNPYAPIRVACRPEATLLTLRKV